MNNNITLYLGSKSSGRRELLDSINVKYKLISHSYDEIVPVEVWNYSLKDYVEFVVEKKFEHIDLNEIKEENFLILVADTMVYSNYLKRIIGKPESINEAETFMRAMSSDFSLTGSAFILAEFENKKLKSIIRDYDEAKIDIFMDDFDIKKYLELEGDSVLNYASGLSIQSCFQNVKKIEGCFSSIIGLPLFKFWQALKKIN